MKLEDFENIDQTLIFNPSLDTQSCIRTPLCNTLIFEKWSTYQPILTPNKILKKNKNTLCYVTCQCGRNNNFEKKIFLAHENIHKLPSKVAHNRPHFFFGPWPKIYNPSHTTLLKIDNSSKRARNRSAEREVVPLDLVPASAASEVVFAGKKSRRRSRGRHNTRSRSRSPSKKRSKRRSSSRSGSVMSLSSLSSVDVRTLTYKRSPDQCNLTIFIQ